MTAHKPRRDCSRAVRRLSNSTRHMPGYVFGVVGKVVGIVGGVVDQDTASRHNAEGPPEPVYRCADHADAAVQVPIDIYKHTGCSVLCGGSRDPGCSAGGCLAPSWHAGDWMASRTCRVAFAQKDVWEGYSGSDKDTVELEVPHRLLDRALTSMA